MPSSIHCPVCKSISFPEGDKQGPIGSVSLFSNSRTTGCSGCGMILDAIHAFDPGWIDIHAVDGSIELTLYGHNLTVHLEDGERFQRFSIFQGQDNSNAIRTREPFFSSLEIIPDTRHISAFERVSSWLTECVEHHEVCKPVNAAFMPRRVLDVSPREDDREEPGDEMESYIRLLDLGLDEALRKPAPYAALSYCWGSDLSGIVVTRKANLTAHFQGIPLSHLAETLQDAIIVTRRLGIRYLWIDALCIVQDDTPDWHRESVQMYSIYSNSHVTIAVHAAPSCKEGFLGRQTYGQSNWQRAFSTNYCPGIHAPQESSTQVKMHVRSGYLDEDPYPLTLRGWTLQEAILPRRIIHYTGAELAWECAERHFCECGHIEGIHYERGMPMVGTRVLRGLEGDGREDLAAHGWMRLVMEYTQRKLSCVSDKLVAVSGIAQLVEARQSVNARASQGVEVECRSRTTISSYYLAGVFSRVLPLHLLWSAKIPNIRIKKNAILEACPRPFPYRAPTWSWASVDSPVEYLDILFWTAIKSHVAVHLEESFIVPVVAGDQTGAVKSGELVVEGPVVPVALITAQRLSRVSGLDSGSWFTDNWSGRTSVVRGLDNGWKEEIQCDFLRPVDLMKGDDGHICWALFQKIAGNHCLFLNHWCDTCRGPRDAGSISNIKPSDQLASDFCCLKVATAAAHAYIDSFYFFLALERSKTSPGAWERVGIGIIPSAGDTDSNEEAENLFKGAETRKLRLV
ncbi:hypothetical protein HGRIS_008598 [Hohenbuehelia grisea]|uniref:Heterokaryon incompatibility domain-containing protein n=1 Tax=Hohenbuehelia grisea TaxID=104357 RepID=A0ABR3J8X1_9AGAR